MSADEFLCLYEAGRREERQTYLLKSAAASDDQNAVAAAAADAVLLSRSAPAAFTAFPSDQGAAAAARSSRQQATEEEDSTRSSSRDLARSSAQAFCGTCHSCFSPIESWMIESFDDDLDLGGSSPPPLSPAAAAAAAGAAGTRSSTGGRGDGRHFDRAVEYSADTSKDGFYDREGDREDAALPTTWAGATAAERDAPSHRPDGSEIRQGDESNVPPPDRERLRLT